MKKEFKKILKIVKSKNRQTQIDSGIGNRPTVQVHKDKKKYSRKTSNILNKNLHN